MRCIACNMPLGGSIMSTNQHTEQEEDMCSSCISKSQYEYGITYDTEYTHNKETMFSTDGSCGGNLDNASYKGYYYDYFDNF